MELDVIKLHVESRLSEARGLGYECCSKLLCDELLDLKLLIDELEESLDGKKDPVGV